MDARLRAHIEYLLLVERDHAAGTLHRAEADEAEAQSVSGGDVPRVQLTPGDAGSDAQEEAADFITATRASAQLAQIDDALRALAVDPDSLGFCMRCGEEVERERLELVPWSRRCAYCARADGKVVAELL